MKKSRIILGLIVFVGVITLSIAQDNRISIPSNMIGQETICPVTGEKFKITKHTRAVKYQGQTYYFCCPGCDKKFLVSPEKYMSVADAKDKSDVEKPAADTTKAVSYWTCSMHPTVHSEKPGNCPICGMKLIPVYKSATSGAITTDEKNKAALGIKSQPIEEKALTKKIEVPGRVANDQELYLAEQDYLSVYNLNKELANSARLKLSLLGFSEQDIKAVEANGHPDESLIYPSEHRAWVIAEIYQPDFGLVKPGQKVAISFPAYPGENFNGTIQYLQPVLDSNTKTAKARILIMHPGKELQLEMYATVEINVSLTKRLAMPVSALINTGQRKIVYLDLGNGKYQARDVVPGLEADNYIQVVSGLQPGDMVVTEGNFLLDSQATLTGGQSLLYGGAAEEVNTVREDTSNGLKEEPKPTEHRH